MSTEPTPENAKAPVIVVGAGLSGLAAAIGVAVRGRRAVVFEAADLVGGAAAYSGGQVWIGANHVAARDGIDDDLERTRDLRARHRPRRPVAARRGGDEALAGERAGRRAGTGRRSARSAGP